MVSVYLEKKGYTGFLVKYETILHFLLKAFLSFSPIAGDKKVIVG